MCGTQVGLGTLSADAQCRSLGGGHTCGRERHVAVDAEQPAGIERRGALSLDALVLVMVTGLTLHLDSYHKIIYTTPGINAMVVGMLGIYLALDVLGRPLL